MNLQKTYLSRAMTRAMALDHPIGDPFGGPAYGERRDPVSAIVAVASMAASAGGAAALIGGTITLGTVAAGLAFAGGAMSLVGNATGNRDLMKIGTIASVAGGIGGFFDAAGFAGTVAKDAAAVSGATGSTAAMPGDFGATEAAAAAQSPGVSDSILGTANPDVIVNAAPAEAIAAPTQLADASVQTSSLVGDAAAAAQPTMATEMLGSSAPTAGLAGSEAGSVAGSIAGGDGMASGAQWDAFTSGYGGQEGLISSNSAAINPAAAAPSTPMSFDSFGNPVAQGSPAATMADPSGLAQAQVDANAATAAANKPWYDSLMPDTSKMSTMDKFLAAKIGSEVVGGVVGYVAPSPQQKAQTQAAQAAAAANQAQADKIKAEEELKQKRLAAIRQNMAMNINMGTVNPNAVTIASPTLRTQPGLINGARTA